MRPPSPAESTLRLLCKVFDVETATVSLLTGERIYLVGACGALPVSLVWCGAVEVVMVVVCVRGWGRGYGGKGQGKRNVITQCNAPHVVGVILHAVACCDNNIAYLWHASELFRVLIASVCVCVQVCVCPDRWGFCGWSFLNPNHEVCVTAASGGLYIIVGLTLHAGAGAEPLSPALECLWLTMHIIMCVCV